MPSDEISLFSVDKDPYPVLSALVLRNLPSRNRFQICGQDIFVGLTTFRNVSVTNSPDIFTVQVIWLGNFVRRVNLFSDLHSSLSTSFRRKDNRYVNKLGTRQR